MKALAKKALLAASALRLLPHVLAHRVSSRRALIDADERRWGEILGLKSGPLRLAELLTFFPEFRNLFYHRLGWVSAFFRFLAPPLSSLYLKTAKIGPGLFIQHGFATIVTAREVGSNCWINQQVTIGYTSADASPVLEDGVVVNAGAIVVGDVRLGAGAIVGAGAVVINDVPPAATVVGVPARVVQSGGRRRKSRGL